MNNIHARPWNAAKGRIHIFATANYNLAWRDLVSTITICLTNYWTIYDYATPTENLAGNDELNKQTRRSNRDVQGAGWLAK